MRFALTQTVFCIVLASLVLAAGCDTGLRDYPSESSHLQPPQVTGAQTSGSCYSCAAGSVRCVGDSTTQVYTCVSGCWQQSFDCSQAGKVCQNLGVDSAQCAVAGGGTCGDGFLNTATEQCDFGPGNNVNNIYRGGNALSCGPDFEDICDAGCQVYRSRVLGNLEDCDGLNAQTSGDACTCPGSTATDSYMSGNGACVSGTVSCGGSPPPTALPGGFAVGIQTPSCSAIKLIWIASSGAVNYKAHLIIGGVDTPSALLPSSALEYTFASLSASTTYNAYVEAINTAGTTRSPVSGFVSTTTPACGGTPPPTGTPPTPIGGKCPSPWLYCPSGAGSCVSSCSSTSCPGLLYPYCSVVCQAASTRGSSCDLTCANVCSPTDQCTADGDPSVYTGRCCPPNNDYCSLSGSLNINQCTARIAVTGTTGACGTCPAGTLYSCGACVAAIPKNGVCDFACQDHVCAGSLDCVQDTTPGQNPNYKGRCCDLGESWNPTTQSCQAGSPPPPSTSPGATLYEHTGYNSNDGLPGAKKQTFTVSDEDLNDNPPIFGNDIASSIKILNGAVVTLYQHANFMGGKHQSFVADDPNFNDNTLIGNDMVSSIWVSQPGVPGAPASHEVASQTCNSAGKVDVVIRWTPPGVGGSVTKYTLSYSKISPLTWLSRPDVIPPVVQQSIPGLDPSVVYNYMIFAFSAQGATPIRAEFTTIACPGGGGGTGKGTGEACTADAECASNFCSPVDFQNGVYCKLSPKLCMLRGCPADCEICPGPTCAADTTLECGWVDPNGPCRDNSRTAPASMQPCTGGGTGGTCTSFTTPQTCPTSTCTWCAAENACKATGTACGSTPPPGGTCPNGAGQPCCTGNVCATGNVCCGTTCVAGSSCGAGTCSSFVTPPTCPTATCTWCAADNTCKTIGSACTAPVACTGAIDFVMDPNPVGGGELVLPSAGGLSSCAGKTIYFRKSTICLDSGEVSKCASGSSGCQGPPFNAPTTAGSHDYIACVDKDDEGDFIDAGEKDLTKLNVTSTSACCTAGTSCAAGSCCTGLTRCSDNVCRTTCTGGVANCTGNIDFVMDPNPVPGGDLVLPTAAGLSSCDGKTIYFRKSTVCLNTGEVSKCVSGTSGCQGTPFNAPNATGSHDYIACVDKSTIANGFNEAGEKDLTKLNVTAGTAGGSPNIAIKSMTFRSSDLARNLTSGETIRSNDLIIGDIYYCDETGRGTGDFTFTVWFNHTAPTLPDCTEAGARKNASTNLPAATPCTLNSMHYLFSAPVKDGTYHMAAYADSLCQITESSEADNKIFFTYIVGQGSTGGGTCSNGIRDGNETAVDCGGNCPTKCSENQACKKNEDCDSGLICDKLVCHQDPNMYLTKPFFGVATSSSFPFSVLTYNPAACKFGFANIAYDSLTSTMTQGPVTFSAMQTLAGLTNGYEHTSPNIQLPVEGQSYPAYVKCKIGDQIYNTTVQLSYDTSPPVITRVFFEPATISDVPFQSKLTVETNEPAFCRYSLDQTNFFSMASDIMASPVTSAASYVTSANVMVPRLGELALEDQHEYGYTVVCINKAVTESAPLTANLLVNTQVATSISIESPMPNSYLATRIVPFIVTTTRLSNCSLGPVGSSKTAPSSFSTISTRHAANITASEGVLTYQVTCSFRSVNSLLPDQDAQVSFAVDTSAPEIISINVTQLGQAAGQSVFTDRLSASWVARDEQSGVKFYTYWLVNESNFTIGERKDTPNTYVQETGLTLINGTRYAFYLMAVNNAGLNVTKRSDFVRVNTDTSGGPASCLNGIKDSNEASQDCGGVCARKCAVGDTCFASTDCQTAYCNQGHACAIASCIDSVQNGNESDKDCGGGICGKCIEDKVCRDDNDCKTDECQAGRCKKDVTTGPGGTGPIGEPRLNRTTNSTDRDGDGVANNIDNCPNLANRDQKDTDKDGIGDVCDDDIDGDGMPNSWEERYNLNPLRDDGAEDLDKDGVTNLVEWQQKTDPTNAPEKGSDGSSSASSFLTILIWIIILIVLVAIAVLGVVWYRNRNQPRPEPEQRLFTDTSEPPQPGGRQALPPPQSKLSPGQQAISRMHRLKRMQDRKEMFMPFDKYAPANSQQVSQSRMEDPFRALQTLANPPAKPKPEAKAPEKPAAPSKPAPKKVARTTKREPSLKMKLPTSKEQVLAAVRDFALDKYSTKALSKKVLINMLGSKSLSAADKKEVISTLVSEKVIEAAAEKELYAKFKL